VGAVVVAPEEMLLYCSVIEAIAERLRAWLCLKPESATRGNKIIALPIPYFYHVHTSDLETYAENLFQVGVFAPITSEPMGSSLPAGAGMLG